MNRNHDAAAITLVHWQEKRTQAIEWLCQTKHFTREAAEKAFDNFTETMVFVAAETARIQVKVQKPWL